MKKTTSKVKFTAGDILLVHDFSFISKAIRLGERIKIFGNILRGRATRLDLKNASKWNHAALIVDENGGLLQALGHGITDGNVSDYKEFKILKSNFTPEQLQSVLKFAKSCVGVPYGYLDIVSIALDIFIPFAHFRDGNTLICSQFVAKAWEHGGWICPKLDTSHVMPSDLEEWIKS